MDLTGLVNAVVTVTDGDDDTATHTFGIGDKLNFDDDGPTLAVPGRYCCPLCQQRHRFSLGIASEVGLHRRRISMVTTTWPSTSIAGQDEER